jgi:hypothetical protein
VDLPVFLNSAIRPGSPVALSLETGKRNAMGLTEYLVIYGTEVFPTTFI